MCAFSYFLGGVKDRADNELLTKKIKLEVFQSFLNAGRNMKFFNKNCWCQFDLQQSRFDFVSFFFDRPDIHKAYYSKDWNFSVARWLILFFRPDVFHGFFICIIIY